MADVRGGGRPLGLPPVAVLVALLLVMGTACGDDGEAEPPEGEPFATGEDMETGGIEVDAPDGWQTLTMPALGFGLAVPEDWEAVVLDQEGLDLLGRAAPEVPDFAMSAVAAAQSGAVFYAAGRDSEDETQVNDVKVLADTAAEVEDAGTLEDYAGEATAAGGLDDPSITVVDDAPHPTVDVRFQSQGAVSHGEGGSTKENADAAEEDVLIEGVQRFVLAPAGAVYSFILTGENATSVDQLAPEILGTVAFQP